MPTRWLAYMGVGVHPRVQRLDAALQLLVQLFVDHLSVLDDGHQAEADL